MDAPHKAGYQIDPLQWDQHVTEAVQFLGHLIAQESINCSEETRIGREVQGTVQVPWKEISGQDLVISIRPKFLVESYSYSDLEERIASLESWRQVAYFYMLERFCQRLFKIESIAASLQTIVPSFQDAESLQSSLLLRSIIVRYARNELSPPTQGERSPQFHALGDRQIVKVLCLLSKIFCEEAKELKQLKEFPPGDRPQVFKGFLAKERSIKVAEDYPFRPMSIFARHAIPNIAARIKQLNPFRSILFSYILQKSAQIIYQDTFLSFFCSQYERDLTHNALLQSSIYKVLSEEAEAYLAIPEKSYTLETVPMPEPTEHLRSNVAHLNDRFSKTKHIAQATLYAPESLFMLDHENLIAEVKERLKSPFTITLIPDDAWEYFLDKVRYRKTVKSLVTGIANAPVVAVPVLPSSPPPSETVAVVKTKSKRGCQII